MEGNGKAGQATADNGNIKFHGESCKNAGFRATFRTIGDLGPLRTTCLPKQKLLVCSTLNSQLSIWVKFFLDQAVVDSFSSIMDATLRFE